MQNNPIVEAFIGEIRMFGFERVPQGWMPCDGRVLPISDYQELYALLGTTYGGNGQTNFALPDMRGRVPLHQGTPPGRSAKVLGEYGGSETVTLTQAMMPQHIHGLTAVNGAATSPSPVGAYPATIPAPDAMYIEEEPSILLHQDAVGLVGAGGYHENRAPILALNFCMCCKSNYIPQS